MKAVVIGAGPAGLMAAETLAGRGIDVTIYEAKPSPARKFLMAGKSGLNLTFEGGFDKVLSGYGQAAKLLGPALQAFDNAALRAWAEQLGQETFVGTSGRVFPRAMKASPLLRAWLARLEGQGVRLVTRHRWDGWTGDDLRIDTGAGHVCIDADIKVLTCGGASWPRLGSDGSWAGWIGSPVTGFAASNAGVCVRWSERMARFFGVPLKGVSWSAGDCRSRGEAVVVESGFEGGGVYPLGPCLRAGKPLKLDLLPDLDAGMVARRIARPRGKASLSNHLRKVLRLDPLKLALANEWAHPLPQDPAGLAKLLKSLDVPCTGLASLDRAISSVGGVPFDALDDSLMLKSRPGTWCAGEMIDWDAPTGGWLLTACFATGAWVGNNARPVG